jgi:hypothetical protein
MFSNKTRNVIDVVLVVFIIWSIVFLKNDNGSAGQNLAGTAGFSGSGSNTANQYSNSGKPSNWPLSPWPNNDNIVHGSSVSNTYLPSHSEGRSNSWPPNHPYQASRVWPVGHDFSPSNSWPAGHIYSYSLAWPAGSHSSSISVGYPSTHLASLSKSWPANHRYVSTQIWPLGAHQRSISEGYSPTNHTAFTSQSWPANHKWSSSQAWPLSNHPVAVSNTYVPGYVPVHVSSVSSLLPVHDVFRSNTWPGGHIYSASNQLHTVAFSNTWPRFPNAHGFDVSITWPANHTHNVSINSTPNVTPPTPVVPLTPQALQQPQPQGVSAVQPTPNSNNTWYTPIVNWFNRK